MYVYSFNYQSETNITQWFYILFFWHSGWIYLCTCLLGASSQTLLVHNLISYWTLQFAIQKKISIGPKNSWAGHGTSNFILLLFCDQLQFKVMWNLLSAKWLLHHQTGPSSGLFFCLFAVQGIKFRISACQTSALPLRHIPKTSYLSVGSSNRNRTLVSLNSLITWYDIHPLSDSFLVVHFL